MFENYKNANNGLNTNFGKSNVWDDDVKISTYLNDTYYNKLTSVAKNQIMRHEWNIGVITYSDDYPAAQLLIDEAKEKWIGNIGTLNPSDYFYASNTIATLYNKAYVISQYTETNKYICTKDGYEIEKENS